MYPKFRKMLVVRRIKDSVSKRSFDLECNLQTSSRTNHIREGISSRKIENIQFHHRIVKRTFQERELCLGKPASRAPFHLIRGMNRLVHAYWRKHLVRHF
jgi:hypothetical protein